MNRLNRPTDDLPPFIDVKHALRSAYLSEVAEAWARTPDPQAFGTRREDDSTADYAQAVWANNVMIENLADVVSRSHDEQILDSHRADLRAPVLDDFDQFEWIGQGVWTLNMVRDLPPLRLLFGKGERPRL